MVRSLTVMPLDTVPMIAGIGMTIEERPVKGHPDATERRLLHGAIAAVRNPQEYPQGMIHALLPHGRGLLGWIKDWVDNNRTAVIWVRDLPFAFGQLMMRDAIDRGEMVLDRLHFGGRANFLQATLDNRALVFVDERNWLEADPQALYADHAGVWMAWCKTAGLHPESAEALAVRRATVTLAALVAVQTLLSE